MPGWVDIELPDVIVVKTVLGIRNSEDQKMSLLNQCPTAGREGILRGVKCFLFLLMAFLDVVLPARRERKDASLLIPTIK